MAVLKGECQLARGHRRLAADVAADEQSLDRHRHGVPQAVAAVVAIIRIKVLAIVLVQVTGAPEAVGWIKGTAYRRRRGLGLDLAAGTTKRIPILESGLILVAIIPRVESWLPREVS